MLTLFQVLPDVNTDVTEKTAIFDSFYEGLKVFFLKVCHQYISVRHFLIFEIVAMCNEIQYGCHFKKRFA